MTNMSLECPKCKSSRIEPCPTCSAGLWRCKDCRFRAPKKYFEGEPLPSKK